MEALLPAIMAQLAPIIITLLSALASTGMVYLNRWLKAKAGMEAAAVVSEVTGTVVAELATTMTKEFKAASKDGKLTKAEAINIKDVAFARIKNQLPNTISKAASKAIGNLGVYLSGKIEEKVNELNRK